MSIYFIQEQGGNCCVKIGFTESDDIVPRLNSLQTGNSSPLHVLGEIPSGTRKLERALHIYFSDYYTRGEWFDIPHDVIEEFMYVWVWPWKSEDEIMMFVGHANDHQEKQGSKKRVTIIDEFDPNNWRVETRQYTKKDGTISTYYNYRRRRGNTNNGKRLVEYMPGGITKDESGVLRAVQP